MNIAAKSTLALLLLCPLTLQAQSRTALAVAAGPSIPIGSLRDTQNQGLDLNIGFIRGSDDSPIGLRFDLGYDRFPGKTIAGVKKADSKFVGGTADIVFSTSGFTLKPYLIAGAGGFKMTSGAATKSTIRFGFDFGIGVTLPLASKAFFVESRVNSVSQHNAKPLRYVPIVLGILF